MNLVELSVDGGFSGIEGKLRRKAQQRNFTRLSLVNDTMGVQLGPVSHFSIGVNDPVASAAWWVSNFDLDEWSRSDEGILLGNDAIMLGLFKGSLVPGVLGHLGFCTSNIDALRAARDVLRANGVDLEDPGDEIGPVDPGSASVGLWFHDLDGYRWELYVEGPDA